MRCSRKRGLVKDIQPKYNIALKDGKSFPFLQITTHEDFPARRSSRATHAVAA